MKDGRWRGQARAQYLMSDSPRRRREIAGPARPCRSSVSNHSALERRGFKSDSSQLRAVERLHSSTRSGPPTGAASTALKRLVVHPRSAACDCGRGGAAQELP